MTVGEAKRKVRGYLTDILPSDCFDEIDKIMKALEQTDKIEESNFSTEQYKADLQAAYDCGYAKALEQTRCIPKNATNGDMIKAIFRHIKGSVLTDHKEVMVVSYKDFINWLNAPYKSDSDKESKK